MNNTRLPLPGCIPENDEISFIEPSGVAIVGLVQEDTGRTWEWTFSDPCDPSQGEYASDGPDSDYSTVELRGEPIWHDGLGRPWLERHLLPPAAGAQPAEIVDLARRDYYAAVAAVRAADTLKALRDSGTFYPGGFSQNGPIADLIGAASLVSRLAEEQSDQLRTEWMRVKRCVSTSVFNDHFWSFADQAAAQDKGWELTEFSDRQICIVADEDRDPSLFPGATANIDADAAVRRSAALANDEADERREFDPALQTYLELCARAVKIATQSLAERERDDAEEETARG